MKEVNLALISKLGWKLHNNSDSLWVNQLRGKYLSTSSFLSPSSHSSPSGIWRGILSSQSIISLGACHRIHKHSPLNIWHSPWVPTLVFFTPSPAPHHSSPPNLVVSDLITPQNSWNFPMLLSIFYAPSVKEIQKISISSVPSSDFIWTPSANGNFSTSSALKLINNPRVASSSAPLDPHVWKLLWKLKLNARLKLFLWKIAWDIVPSKARISLILHIPPSDSFCPLCKSEVDSLHHLFFRCIFARVAWRQSFWPLDSQSWSSLSLPNWIKGIILPHLTFGIPKTETHLFQIFATVLCDLLWYSRNKAVHEGIIPNILQLADTIKKIALAHSAAWKPTPVPIAESWSPPAIGSFKINFDTAIRDNFSAQAAVCRDHNGSIISACSQISPSCDPIYGEALAAFLAATLVASLKLNSFSIEGDSLIVISALQAPSPVHNWQIERVIADSINIIPASCSWEARKINRSANFCAHHVTHWAALGFTLAAFPFFSPLLPLLLVVVVVHHLLFSFPLEGVVSCSISNAIVVTKKEFRTWKINRHTTLTVNQSSGSIEKLYHVASEIYSSSPKASDILVDFTRKWVFSRTRWKIKHKYKHTHKHTRVVFLCFCYSNCSKK
jgi:hypothetical protein